MFGFDGDKKGLRQILCKISENEKSQNLTHKEVRAYARCLLKLLPNIMLCPNQREEIKTLLAAISIKGIAHYDRSFLATQILALLAREARVESIEVVNQSANNDNF